MSRVKSLPTLESTVTLYRRASKDVSYKDAYVEFEIRFRDVDDVVFWDLLEALVAKKLSDDGGGGLSVGDGEISHTVNSIMVEGGKRRGGLDTNLVRQVTFKDGARLKDKYYMKWPMDYPYRVKNQFALSYSVVTSVEKPLTFPFSSTSSATIRVKTRVGFLVRDGDKKTGAWRVDLTVTRQLGEGANKSDLPRVVKKMFKPGMTPQNMRALLDPANVSYKYEVEVEYIAGTAEEKDALRPEQVTGIVGKILQLTNPEYLREAAYQAEIYHVARYAVPAPGTLAKFEHTWGLKNLTPQVAALSRTSYAEVYPPTGFFLLDKADGVRCIASVREGRLLLLADELVEFYAPGFSDKGKVSTEAEAVAGAVVPDTVVDGELVRDGGRAVFYAFDVIALKKANLTKEGYEKRAEALPAAVEILNVFGSPAFAAKVKASVRLTASEPEALRAQFKSPVFASPPYETDGKILVEPGKPYRDTVAYKWKPLENTTIDFLARRPPTTVLGTPPYVDRPGHKLYFLFVGITPDLYASLGLERVEGYNAMFGDDYAGSYFPIQFAPSITPLAYMYQHPTKPVDKGKSDVDKGKSDVDGKIVELRCAKLGDGPSAIPEWELVRIREDRARELKMRLYYGNNFRVAELTWLNYVFPFPEKRLWEGTDGYFATTKNEMYQAQTGFTSFVKSRRIEKDLAHASWVVDLAAGKGQDLRRFRRAEVRNLVAVDRDRTALAELIQRKYTMQKQSRSRKKRGGMTLYALNADLSEPFKVSAGKIRSVVRFPQAGANAVVCNLAIHYFAERTATLRNFVALCKEIVKVDGLVVITAMFGQKVLELLAPFKTGESWDYRFEGVLKHSVKRLYAEDVLTSAGQKIGVMLPFSGGEYYEEYLVNVEFLAELFAKRGFELVAKASFSDYVAEFKTHNPAVYNMLTDGDLVFLGLYGELVFRRVK